MLLLLLLPCWHLQGTEAPECQAARQAGGAARGGTAYLSLESGDCHGDRAAVDALLAAGVARVVVGLRHPLPHLRGVAVTALRAAGVAVLVLGEAPLAAGLDAEAAEAALDACLLANEALLHRAVTRRPLGLLKYAMTLDGKIATHTGHSAWVSSPQSRQQVFETRSRSDAVIVGGCTGE
jgi:diaminohydroxyphosphoribosylaminopyrimidine deaminase/5-amino-6-(5-phosphoribosylamino)uracil reductase